VITKRLWEVLRNISSASIENGISNRKLICSMLDGSCSVWLHGAGVSLRPAIYSESF